MLQLSVVAPMYNESQGIVQFVEELLTVLESLDLTFEVVLVDDGSDDSSAEVVLNQGWSSVRVLALTRNCGHQLALEAGLAVARGDYVVTMDSDGQHPPDLIPKMLFAAREHNSDVVYTVQEQRSRDSRFKNFFGVAYYWIVRLLTGVPVEDSQADFRLVSRVVLNDISHIPGRKVMRLLLPAIGYSSETLTYVVRPRNSGRGRFGVSRQIKMALDSVLDFSALPLRLVAIVGIGMSILSMLWLLYVAAIWISTQTVEGWASVMFAVLVSGGLTLTSVSLVGEYVARVYDLLKNRPRYVMRMLQQPVGQLPAEDSVNEENIEAAPLQ